MVKEDETYELLQPIRWIAEVGWIILFFSLVQN